MKKIFLRFWLVCLFWKLIKGFESDYLYAWTENNDNPMTFGLSYLSMKTSSINNFNYLTEVLETKKNEAFEILRKKSEILFNNVENLRFFSILTSEFTFNDGMNHEKIIKDLDLAIEINIKSLKKIDGFIVNFDFQGKAASQKKEYYSLFFYIYSPNVQINYTFLDEKRDVLINNHLRLRLQGSQCRGDFIGFRPYSLEIKPDLSNQIDEILLDILNNNLVLPKESNNDDQKKNLVFFQAFIPKNIKCQIQISKANNLNSLLYSKYLVEQYFIQEFETNQIMYNKTISKFFLYDPTKTSNYTSYIDKLPNIFSNFLGSLGHFSGKLPLMFVLDDSPMFKARRSYSLLSYEPFSLFSHGFALFLTCKFDIVLCSSLLQNLLDQVNFAGWLPIHLYFSAFSTFQKEKETLTAPPTFVMAIEYISKTLYYNPQAFDTQLRLFLINFLRVEVYPKLQLIFKYYLHSFRQLPRTFENLGNSYFHWNEGYIGDYPRILAKDNTVEHLDLICWIADTAIVLTQLANQLGNFADAEEYNSMIKDFILKEFPYKYLDFKEPVLILKDIISLKYMTGERAFSGRVGFSSIMPLVKGILDVSDVLVDNTIEYLLNEKWLWSKYGVKIIDGADEATNFVSFECNWLILRGLKVFYWQLERARTAYQIIRTALLENIMKHFENEGAVFEKYRFENGSPVGEPSKLAAGLTILIINEDFY